MKPLLFSCLTLFSAAFAFGQPNNPTSAGPIDGRDRLVQEYMAKRAEWVEARRKALAEAKEAKTDAEKKNILKKLEDDEKALRAAAADLTRQVRDAEKVKQNEGKPRN